MSKNAAVALVLSLALHPPLFPQSVLQGVVRDTGLDPVQNALVELTDEADTTRRFSDHTDALGRYSIPVTETAVEGPPFRMPGALRLHPNYPNPFNPSTVISFESPETAPVRLDLYDVLGRKVRTLLDGFESGPSGRVAWNGTDDRGRGVPAGVYVCVLSAGGVRAVRKMLLIDGGSVGAGGAPSGGVAAPGGRPKAGSNRYRMRVTCDDIEPWEQSLDLAPEQTVLDILVHRTVSDIDGNRYRTVKIGDQWWTAENLRVTRYGNGEEIPNVTRADDWGRLETGAYCDYDSSLEISAIYGHLYNWHAVADPRRLAPPGWHVPSDAEWQVLTDSLEGDLVAGGRMKETGTTRWLEPNTDATNESGFSALPGGNRFHDGAFQTVGYRGYFWSSTEYDADIAWGRALGHNSPRVFRSNYYKKGGYSVRLVRD